MSKRILVTGATGFVGAHICHQALQLGWDVYGLKRENSNTRHFDDIKGYYEGQMTENAQYYLRLKQALAEFADQEPAFTFENKGNTGSFQWVSADLLQMEEVIEILNTPFDYIIHTSALISFDRKSKEDIISKNISMARNLVNACLIQGQTHLIHISSIAALGRPDDHREIQINSNWSESSFNTGYALSKHLSEMELWRGAHEGLQVLIVNPGVILGYSSLSHSSAQKVVESATGKLPFVPEGSNGFIFVEDLCFRTLSLLTTSENWNCRHLMVSHNIRFIDLFRIIQTTKGMVRKNILLKQPLWGIAWLLVRFMEVLGLSLPLSSELLKSTRKMSRYDNRKGFTRSVPMA
jgi:dihydroflavonol-4-reductase